MKFYKFLIFLLIVIGTIGYSKPRVTFNSNNVIHYAPNGPNAPVLKFKFLDANNISSIFWNTGVFDQDPRTTNTPGFTWPKGSGKNACFTAGLSIGCYIVNNAGVPTLAECMASYKGEYVNGAVKYVNNLPTIDNDPKFRMYYIKAGDNSANNPDYNDWSLMIPYGAPYEDVNHNGQWDPGIDVPGQKNAGQTIFQVLTDADSSARNAGEGFGGGITSPLMYAEIHFTAWAYNTPGLEDLQFVNWVVINKGVKTWDSTFTGVVVDSDLGDANDDYIGCDTTNKLNLGYCYNGTASDAVYGSPPPAFGMDYFKSPIIKTPGFPNDTLGLTSFTFFTNTSVSPPPCESDPNGEPFPAYLNLKGVKKDGSPFLDPTQSPPVQTKFCYTGDPESGNGWTEFKGCIQNCGGLTGTQLTVNPVGDRRFIFASGRTTFKFNPGDTQNIVLGQFVAKGTSNKNSVTVLKRLAKTAKLIYLSNFNVTPPPPPPQVSSSFTPLANGQCNISLNWGTASESYRYWDSIFFQGVDSNIYTFQGYEVYEINKNFNGSFPDFSKPETIDLRALQLIDSYDIIDGWGVVVDTFSTGAFVNGTEQYGVYSIVPPYKLTTGADFPELGIKRGITMTQTRFPENYGGISNFIYGQDYQFAVVAYGISKSNHLKRGFRVIRNSVQSQAITVRPIAPPAGSSFTFHNGDTLFTNVRDLSFIPIIRNQNLLQNATYRLTFNTIASNGDTTYKIQRRLNTETSFTTLNDNVIFTGKTNNSADMNALTVDGVLMKMSKIRYPELQGVWDGTKKLGLIKDFVRTIGTDSLQTRQNGWEYYPASHRFVEGSRFKVDQTKPWQSVSMSASYPSGGTYNGLGSLTQATDLKQVKIVFSATNTCWAYRYKEDGDVFDNYNNMVQVPFRVYEVDPKDSTPNPVQLNVGIIDTNVSGLGGWAPSADSLGAKLRVVIFHSAYDTNITSYKYDNGNPVNIYFNQMNMDIDYIWAPKIVNNGPQTFVDGDELWFYPYTISIPYIGGPNYPMYYEFTTTAPIFGDPNVAKNQNDLDKIRVVPNPYYGFSTLDRTTSDKFVTFRNLPLNCTIKIYTLNGDLIRTLVKTNTGNSSTSSTLEWNLQNLERTPIASGIYVALIDAPGIGTKVIKLVIFTSKERINF